jgi:hypothetical protein
MCESMPSSQKALPRRSLSRSFQPITSVAWLGQLLLPLGFALALGACSKCDVPDLGHWGSPPPPHACHDGPEQQ